mgnify:CR=1 FL=1
MLSRKMSMVEWDPGAEPGVEESPGSNSPGDPGTLKGAMVVFSLALSRTWLAVVAAAGPMVTLPVVMAVSTLPAASPPAVPPVPAVPPGRLSPASAVAPPASPGAGEGAEAPSVRGEPGVHDGGGAAGPRPP